MTTLMKILIFFRLVDAHDNTISISNIALYISLYRLVTVPQASYTDVGAVMVTFMNYGYKKFINQNQPTSKGNNINADS